METTPVGAGAAAPHRSRNGNDGAAVRFPHRHQFPARFRTIAARRLFTAHSQKSAFERFVALQRGPAPNHVLVTMPGACPAPHRSIPARGLPGCDTGAQWRTVAAPSRWRQAVGGDRKRRSGSEFLARAVTARARRCCNRSDARQSPPPKRVEASRPPASSRPAPPGQDTRGSDLCPATRPYLACAGLTGSRPILRP